MTRRLVLSYLAIAAFVLVVLEVPLGISYARTQLERLTVDVERDAVVIASRVEDTLQAGRSNVEPGLDAYLEATGGRVTITDAAGRSVFDSDPELAPPRDYSTRPEVAAALAGERASGTRRSDTLGTTLLYVAIPVASGGEVHGVVRITYPTTAVDARVRRNWLVLAAIAATVLTSTAAVGWALARWVSRPIRAVARAASGLSEGDLGARADADHGPPEVRDLAGRFNTMADRLSELIVSQRAFVADASHQLRSPLTALRLELEGAIDDPDPAALERALHESHRLGRLVDGLLVLARADGARPTLERIDLTRLLDVRRDVWGPVAEDAGVHLRLVVDRGLEVLAVDGHLEQVVDNLVANAIEAAPRGGSITIRASDGDPVVVLVDDDGPGMSPEARVHAFDRFWRGPDADRGGGSGLGLAIARQLSRACGGDLDLDVSPDGGLRARIRLPRARVDDSGHAGRVDATT